MSTEPPFIGSQIDHELIYYLQIKLYAVHLKNYKPFKNENQQWKQR